MDALTALFLALLGWLLVAAVITWVTTRNFHQQRNQQGHRDARYGREIEHGDRRNSLARTVQGDSTAVRHAGVAISRTFTYATRYADMDRDGADGIGLGIDLTHALSEV